MNHILTATSAAGALRAAHALPADRRAALLDGTHITDDGSLELGPLLEEFIGEAPGDYHVALALLAAAGHLDSVEILYVFNIVDALPDLASLDWLPALQTLTVSGYTGRSLGPWKITTLCIAESPSLTDLNGLRALSVLKTLTLSYCPELGDASALSALPMLASVTIGGCDALDPSLLVGRYAVSVDD